MKTLNRKPPKTNSMFRVTVVAFILAFVYIFTIAAITNETIGTATCITAFRVSTSSIGITVI